MDERDVVVVGAGLAGLTAARELHDAGHDVVVWEARDRVGGRTWTSELDGAAIDLGAQWLGPEQHRMHALADRFGLARFPTWNEGDSLVVDGDDRTSYGGTVPLLGPVQLARMAAALLQLRVMARTAERGRMDRWPALGTSLSSTIGDDSARRVVDAAVRVIFGEEPTRVSAAWAAAYAAAAGGDLLDLAAIEGGAQQTRLVGGTQAFSAALADGLDVVLERPVAAIERDTDGVTVTASTGERVRARHVVAAVPPPLLAAIDHTPPLPEPLRATLAATEMGSTTKVFVAYDEPFWRADGLRGEAVVTDGPVQVVFDNCSADGSVPMLLAFVTGDAARQAADASDDDLRPAVLAALVRAFGDRAATPEAVVQHHWQREPWTGGCPTANLTLPLDHARGPGVLRRGVGRLHLAGTETAREWRGYMEGAVESGERAAAEVRAALG